MPYNHTKLELQLSECDRKLHDLFSGCTLSEQLTQRITSVKDYYNLSYIKATSGKTAAAIANSYSSLITHLSQVKNGTLKASEALEKILSNSESRKMNVLFHDLAKASEFIFWAATTCSLYAGLFGVALPVLIVTPLLGAAVGITFIGALLAAAYKGISCLMEFRSYSRHDVAYTNEASLVSFFKPQRQVQKGIMPIEKEELKDTCCVK